MARVGIKRARADELAAALIGVARKIADAEPWVTCVADGCLCKPSEVCPVCKLAGTA